MYCEVTRAPVFVISASSGEHMWGETTRPNEGLKRTADLQLIDSYTPWVIVSDSGEHHYTCPLLPYLIMKSGGGGGALEERNVIDFDTICFTAFKMNVALHVQFYVFIKKK